MDELATRHVRWDPIETAWARNRPAAERTPIPSVGDRLAYRHDEWSDAVEEIEVLEVQALDDHEDPNLWISMRDGSGNLLLRDGKPIVAPMPDPWPWILFRRDPLSDRTTWSREARLRGSAGWLPLDWASRPERSRMPWDTALIVGPVPAPQITRPPSGGELWRPSRAR